MKRKGETIYNFFLFISDGIIHKLGMTSHVHSGHDSEKLAFLRRQASQEYENCQTFKIPDRISCIDKQGVQHKGKLTYQSFLHLQTCGAMMGVFEEVFAEVGSVRDPLLCITPVVDGKPRIEGISDIQGGNVQILN